MEQTVKLDVPLLNDNIITEKINGAGEPESLVIKSTLPAAAGFDEIGYVTAVTDGIAYVHGLENIFAGEVVRFNNSILGLAVNLEETVTGVTIFGNDREIVQGDYVERLYTVLEVPTGPALLGRTVDALGNFIDEDSLFTSGNDVNSSGVESVLITQNVDAQLDSTENSPNEELYDSTVSLGIELRPIEIKAAGIISRMSVNEPLLTGIIAVDSMIPIGRGQRELIIGDRQTGKTAIAIDTIINQHGRELYV